MADGRAIGARAARVFQPGMRVEDRRGTGTAGHVIVPGERMLREPHNPTDVAVLWDKIGRPTWVEQRHLRYF